jgi:hypothetical protein
MCSFRARDCALDSLADPRFETVSNGVQRRPLDLYSVAQFFPLVVISFHYAVACAINKIQHRRTRKMLLVGKLVGVLGQFHLASGCLAGGSAMNFNEKTGTRPWNG